MALQSQLALINDFIENFNVDEFSSSATFDNQKKPTKKDLLRAWKMKEKLGRKNRMAEAFTQSIVLDFEADQKVCITQEEIDSLLESI